MADIKPFKGLLYSKPDQRVVAPPYDVIDPDYRSSLKERSPHNIVNIILPDSYEKAAALLNEWLKNGILSFDERCNHYIYTAEYQLEGRKKTLKGIITALRLEEFGGSIKPHEKTLKGPKIDRFNLITKTHAMFCPIMGLYDHKSSMEGFIDEATLTKPVLDVEFENIRHRIYRNSSEIPERELKNETIIIADGHHRYETALMIRDYLKKEGKQIPGADYIIILLVDAISGGLSLLPIHRVVKRLSDKDEFMGKLKEYFTVTPGKDQICDFIMYTGGEYFCLRLKQKKPNDILKRLDVSIFEEYIYKKILKLTDEDIRNQKIAGYAHSHDELKRMVDSKEADAGFLLKPMKYSDLIEIATRGLTVPQKSTFFYPKIPSGLVGYHFKSIEGCNHV